MTWLSIVLIGIGAGDIVRSTSWRRARLTGHVLTPAVVAGVALLAGMHTWADALALTLATLAAAAWAELARRTQATGRGALAALALFAVVVLGLLGASGAASPVGGPLQSWLRWADLPGAGVLPTARVLVLTGLVVFNVATANVIVRLVLLTIGALQPADLTRRTSPSAGSPAPGGQPADRLKGGRLLGPMERLVILGLGVAGEFGAAGLVIAAKGLLRFPEIQAAARPGPTPGGPGGVGGGSYPGGPAGIDDVTEYFLVGSFVSWLIALASLALAR